MPQSKSSGIVIAGVGSNSGKTAAAIGLMAALRERGIPVQPAKAGPDFLDAAWLATAAQRPCPNLDIWMASEPANIMSIARQFAAPQDFLLVEGAMGLYDGAANGSASTADLARLLGLPVLLLLNCKGMGQSVAPVAQGMLAWPARPQFCGIVCTHTGSQKHERILKKALDPVSRNTGIPVLGFLPVKDAPVIPARHLGLVHPSEIDLDIKKAGEWFQEHVNIDLLLQYIVKFPFLATVKPSCGKKNISGHSIIAIARDEAFSFCYADLQGFLESFGASVVYFSPLRDALIPKCHALYFPGGYPELHAQKLACNRSMRAAVADLCQAGMPIYGECGGYMYLLQTIEDSNGQAWPMAALLPGKAKMRNHLSALGYRVARAKDLNGKWAYGHEFHYATASGENAAPLWEMWDAEGRLMGKCGQLQGNVAGGWLHTYPQGSRSFWENFIDLAKKWAEEHA